MQTDATHYAIRDIAEAHLAAMDWTETAVNTWTSPDGNYQASFANVLGSVALIGLRRIN